MEFLFSLEVIGALIGILYLVLEYRASVWLWPVGVVMPTIYIYICYKAGIYADMGINVYFLVAAIYGWIVWHKSSLSKSESETESEEQNDKIVNATTKEWIWCSLTFSASFAILAYILVNFTPSTVPYCDSLTTALSVIGMWMLAHKRIEHWLVWIAVDAVSAAMYIEKGLIPTAILYAIYTIIALAGYYKWLRLMKEEATII